MLNYEEENQTKLLDLILVKDLLQLTMRHWHKHWMFVCYVTPMDLVLIVKSNCHNNIEKLSPSEIEKDIRFQFMTIRIGNQF